MEPECGLPALDPGRDDPNGRGEVSVLLTESLADRGVLLLELLDSLGRGVALGV